jgi:hypothetical protein
MTKTEDKDEDEDKNNDLKSEHPTLSKFPFFSPITSKTKTNTKQRQDENKSKTTLRVTAERGRRRQHKTIQDQGKNTPAVSQ